MSQEKQPATVDDDDAARTVDAKKRARNELDSDVEAFLAQGGAIEQVDNNVTADPPSLPSSRYGGRPI